jgi:acetyl-CoA acetyltransferase
LRPAFDKAGTVTAGNASGLTTVRRLVVMEESAALAAG